LLAISRCLCGSIEVKPRVEAPVSLLSRAMPSLLTPAAGLRACRPLSDAAMITNRDFEAMALSRLQAASTTPGPGRPDRLDSRPRLDADSTREPGPNVFPTFPIPPDIAARRGPPTRHTDRAPPA
jgi:hypothetical protein